jgi:hypothetical protein
MRATRCVLTVLALSVAIATPAFAGDQVAGDPAVVDPVAVDQVSSDDTSPITDNPLFTPAPQPAAPPCAACFSGFTTSPGGGQASHWGFGSDCSAAQTDVRSQLLAYTTAECQSYDGYGRCGFQLVVTWCGWNGSQYQADAYANFSCWLSIC